MIVPSRIQECSMFPRYVEKNNLVQSPYCQCFPCKNHIVDVVQLRIRRYLPAETCDFSCKTPSCSGFILPPAVSCDFEPSLKAASHSIIRDKVEFLTPRQWGAKERRSERDDSAGLSSHKFNQFGLHGKAPFFTTNLWRILILRLSKHFM